MSGVFAEWQPRYAEHNVATFPVSATKIPSVKNYLRIGLDASNQFALRFADNDAFGFACRRNRITVLDVDTSDERVLEDGLARHGPTPFIVRSGSGNFQAWYRHNGERRRVRPDVSRPIDILGDGFVVAPPSKGAKGRYEIIQGTLDDLDRLPRMRTLPTPDPVELQQSEVVKRDVPAARSRPLSEPGANGTRNDTLFRRLLRAAHHTPAQEELMQIASRINSEFPMALGTEEVMRTVASVWRYKEQGRLFVPGGEANAVVFHSDVQHLWDQPLALSLLIQLRMAHGWRNGSEFTLALAMADTMGVSPKTFRSARDILVERYFLEITHPGGRGKNDPPRARLL